MDRWYIRAHGPTGWLYYCGDGVWTVHREDACVFGSKEEARELRAMVGLRRAAGIARRGPRRGA